MVEIDYRDYGWGGEITARGHAGRGEYGLDAVCAGVSALLVTLAKRLEGRSGCSAELRPGRAHIAFVRRGRAGQDVEFTLSGLRWIAEENPAYARLKETRETGR